MACDPLSSAAAAAAGTGFAAAVAWKLIDWMTSKLNGRLDRIAEKLDEIVAREERILARLEALDTRK